MKSYLLGGFVVAAALIIQSVPALSQSYGAGHPRASHGSAGHGSAGSHYRYGGYVHGQGGYGYRQGGYGYGQGGYGYGVGAGVAGLAAGALIGGAIASQNQGYYPVQNQGYYPVQNQGYYPVESDPGYGNREAAPVVVNNGDSVAYCEQTYRSYDPASGSYLGYDGFRHACP
jgi:hypothetical protein